MKRTLDGPVMVGDTHVGVIVETEVRHLGPPAIAFWGEKRPVAVLIARDGRTTAYETDGAPIALASLTSRYPGPFADFLRKTA